MLDAFENVKARLTCNIHSFVRVGSRAPPILPSCHPGWKTWKRWKHQPNHLKRSIYDLKHSLWGPYPPPPLLSVTYHQSPDSSAF